MQNVLKIFEQKRPLSVDTSVHYDTFCFNGRSDLEKFRNEVTRAIPQEQRKSQWYGDITQSVTVLHVPQVIREVLRTKESFISSRSPQSIIAVLPAQLKSPNKIVGIFDEYKFSFADLQTCLEKQSELFEPPNTVFLSVRFSEMSNQKIRNLFLAEMFNTVICTARQYFHGIDKIDKEGGEKAIVNIVMNYKDADQCGLYKQFSSCTRNDSLDFEQEFVQLFIPFQYLTRFTDKLQQIDSLVIDLVITANDLKLLGERTDELNICALPKTVSKKRSIDAVCLKKALQAADAHPETINKHKLETAARHLVALLNVAGLSFELPVKYIKEKESVYLYKQHNGAAANLKGSTFVSFQRTVRDVDESGYKVKLVSVYFWIVIVISVIFSVIYAICRRHIGMEDLIQAISSFVTLFVGAATTFILNTQYKGEALFDVLTNLRKIDTQEEFDKRQEDQVPDIIEVLRTSKSCPQFLGGGQNTSYIRNTLPNAGLQAKLPMAFSNLQNIGYGLFECQEDMLFMIDPWNNVYKVSIINHRESLPKFRDRPLKNEYRSEVLHPPETTCGNTSDVHERRNEVAIPILNDSMSEDLYGATGHEDLVNFMTLFCTPLEVKDKVDRSNLEVTDENDPNFRCIIVREKSTDVTKHLSRVLPYRMKFRPVGVMGRYARLDVTWKLIRNRDIIRMDVGIQYAGV